MDPPHSAADGARQLRVAARLEPSGADDWFHRAFKPEPYWLVDARFEPAAGESGRQYAGRYHAGAKPRLATAAEAEARGVLEAAADRARRLRADADAYADERLATLEETLSRLLGTVERGRELLARPVSTS